MLEIKIGVHSGGTTEIRGDAASLRELAETIQRALMFGSDVSDIMHWPGGGEYQIDVIVNHGKDKKHAV